MEKRWKLGDDISEQDALLDGVSFDELIMTVRCNCRKITPEAVEKEMNRIIEIHMQDMNFLLKNNMNEIIAEAKKGR